MTVKITELRTGFSFEHSDQDALFESIIKLNKITDCSYSLIRTAITLDNIFNHGCLYARIENLSFEVKKGE